MRGDHEVNEIKLANAPGRRSDVRAGRRRDGARGHRRAGRLRRPGRARRRRAAGGRPRHPRPDAASAPAPTRPTPTSPASIWGRDAEPSDVGRPAPGARRRRLPALRHAARGVPRHRGRPRLQARHQVLRGDGRDLPRRGRAPSSRSIMGCYGIGITRTVAAAIEQNHDEDGIIWPLPLAPFQVLLVVAQPQGRGGAQCRRRALRRSSSAPGVEVLYDDRDERPGVKFKDADLIGIPFRVVVGGKSAGAGKRRALAAARPREARGRGRRRAGPGTSSLVRAASSPSRGGAALVADFAPPAAGATSLGVSTVSRRVRMRLPSISWTWSARWPMCTTSPTRPRRPARRARRRRWCPRRARRARGRARPRGPRPAWRPTTW